MTTSRFAAIAGFCIITAGCAELASLTRPSGSTAQAATPVPTAGSRNNPEVVQALSEVQTLQNEVKELRNTVERQAFELDKLKNRQADLYEDLDRRLREFERGRGAGIGTGTNTFSSTTPTIGSNTGINTGTGLGQTGQSNINTGSGQIISSTAITAPTNQGVSNIGQQGGIGQPLTTGQTPSIQPSTVIVGSSQNQSAGTTTGVSGGQVAIVQPDINAATTLSPVTVSAQDAYEQAFGLLKQSRYADALLAFQSFVQAYPANDLTDDAYFWMAESNYVTREFDSALTSYRTVIANFPDSQRVPRSYLKIGYIQYETGAYAEARETLGYIMKNFPTHRIAVDAETRLKKMDREGR